MIKRSTIEKLLTRRRYKDAEAFCTQRLEADPHDDWAYFKRGVARANMELHAEALADFEQVLAINPRSHQTYVNRGLCKQNLKHYARAEKDFRLGLEVNPLYAYGWTCLGWLYHNIYRRHEEAIAFLSDAIQIDPECDAYHDRGEAYLVLNKLPEALADAREALRLHPSDAFSHLLYAEVESAMGNYETFYQHFARALAMDSEMLDELIPATIERHILEPRFQAIVSRYLPS